MKSLLYCRDPGKTGSCNHPLRRIISLLKPNFAEDGSNERLYQNKVHNIFVKYLREAGSKYFVVVVVVVVVVLLLVDVFEASFLFLYPLKASENL